MEYSSVYNLVLPSALSPWLSNVPVTLQNPSRLQDHLFYGAFWLSKHYTQFHWPQGRRTRGRWRFYWSSRSLCAVFWVFFCTCACTLIPGFCSAIKHTAPVKCLPCIIHSCCQGELWLSNPTQYEQHVVLWADQASASTLQSYILFCVLYIQATIKYLITAWMILISYCVNWVGWQRRAWRAREEASKSSMSLWES